MLTIDLFPRSEEDPYLSPQEIVSRVKRNFPGVTIDWDAANERRRGHLSKMRRLGTPEEVLRGEVSLLGKAVLMMFVDPGAPEFRGVTEAIPNDSLVMWSEPEENQELLGSSAIALAEVLEYEWEFCEDDL